MRGEHAAYRVTVVCWGNICRSPMGELMLREAFDEADLGDRVVVDSAGTSTDELGRPMDRRTTATLRRHGVTDTGFAAKRARQFRADSFDDSDLVLAADHVHDEILRRRARGLAMQPISPERTLYLSVESSPEKTAMGAGR